MGLAIGRIGAAAVRRRHQPLGDEVADLTWGLASQGDKFMNVYVTSLSTLCLSKDARAAMAFDAIFVECQAAICPGLLLAVGGGGSPRMSGRCLAYLTGGQD